MCKCQKPSCNYVLLEKFGRQQSESKESKKVSGVLRGASGTCGIMAMNMKRKVEDMLGNRHRDLQPQGKRKRKGMLVISGVCVHARATPRPLL